MGEKLLLKVPFHKTIPNWAKPAYGEMREKLGYTRLPALKAGEQDQAEPVSGGPEAMNIDRSYGTLNEAKSAFRYYQELDGSEADVAPEPDVVKTKDGRTVWLSGTPEQGELLSTVDDYFSVQVLDGKTSESFRTQKNAFVGGHSLDLAHRDGSVEVSEYFNPQEVRPDLSRTVHAQATTNGASFLKSTKGIFHDVFLTGQQSMVDVRAEILGEFEESLPSLSPEAQEKLGAILDRKGAHTPHQLYAALTQLGKGSQDSKLRELRDTAGQWQALEDFPKLMADGVLRTSEHYVAPQTLQLMTASQGWDFDKETGLPIADSIVVGGGPGGLASAYHLSEGGARTIIFEGGNIGQSFSDASAKSVHQLRTDEESTRLIYYPDHRAVGVDVNLDRQSHWNQKEAEESRQQWTREQNEPAHGVAYSSALAINAVTRAEFFQHMSQLAHGLATRYPDSFVVEKSPVQSFERVEREGETLVRVKTAQGHDVLTRSLVISTGFVGSHGENARSLEQFENLEASTDSGVTVLSNDHDLVSKNDRIKNDKLVFSDRLLGRPEIREQVKNLPEGARIGVVGGGESAAKGALELVHLNPGIVVDLYSSKPLEPYQTQVPANVISPAVIEAAIDDPELAQKTFEEMEDFGSPITVETLRELLEFESAGRVRIREMGKRFDQETVKVESTAEGFQMTVLDAEVQENLKQQRQSWAQAGFYRDTAHMEAADHFPNTAMMMMGAGYDFRAAQAGPMIQNLQDEGLLTLENGKPVLADDGISSAKNALVTFNTAAVASQAGDTTLQARSVKGLRLAEILGERLPERERPSSTIDRELPWGEIATDENAATIVFPERAKQIIDNEGYDDGLVAFYHNRVKEAETERTRELAELGLEARLSFPGQNHILRNFVFRHADYPETFTPAEKLLLERGYDVSERVHPKAKEAPVQK